MKTASVIAAAAIGLLPSAGEATPKPALAVEPGPARLHADFPDPFLLAANGRIVAYATNGNRRNVQMAETSDLKRWRRLRQDAMPRLPDWAVRGHTWAPEVLAVTGAAGPRYNLYFTARHRDSALQCIGVATSDTPVGPFVSASPAPLVCQFDEGGSIDASPFRDSDGALYLHFKNDGNHVGRPTRIYAQRLTADGLGLAGEPASLLANDAPWEGHVIEAPTMVRRDGAYLLLFSANDFGWPPQARLSPYAVGLADCAGPMGPCVDRPGNPVLASRTEGPGGCQSGPGHQAVLDHRSTTWIAYHAWDATPDCRPAGQRRRLHIGRIHWTDKPQAPTEL